MPRTNIQIPLSESQAKQFQNYVADRVMSGSRVMDAFADARIDLSLRKYTSLTLKDFYYAINRQYGPVVKWDKHTKSWSRLNKAIASPTKTKLNLSKRKAPTSIKDTVQGETLDLSKTTRGNDLAYLEIKLGSAEIKIQFKED